MKRFLMFSVSILCLAVAMLLIAMNIMAQHPQILFYRSIPPGEGALYTYHFAFAADGNVYAVRNEMLYPATELGFLIGNFWEGIEQPNYEIVNYSVYARGRIWILHYIILSNGNIYMRISDHNNQVFHSNPCLYIGNFWEGAVSTEQNSWSGVKNQFNK